MDAGDWIGLIVAVIGFAGSAAVVYGKLCVVISKVSSLETVITQLFAKDTERELRCAKHLLRTDDLDRRVGQIEDRA